ncbi:MAG: hypothetical protein OXR68_06105 [Alphaproteobacteria bacterium]|nr:hypothetical protein [Alphaproteobacteria bacterium]MDD9920178.1 hypothetical protein [Alphaproteobacteria bacterium]
MLSKKVVTSGVAAISVVLSTAGPEFIGPQNVHSFVNGIAVVALIFFAFGWLAARFELAAMFLLAALAIQSKPNTWVVTWRQDDWMSILVMVVASFVILGLWAQVFIELKSSKKRKKLKVQPLSGRKKS